MSIEARPHTAQILRVALVTPGQRGPHPRAALRFTNPADTSLPPGLPLVVAQLDLPPLG